jgi:alpha-galactosidase
VAESKKIVCLGGGSLYFRRAVPDLLVNPDLAGSEIVLYDIDREKVEAMSAVHEALARQAGTGCRVRATDDLADAVDGSDFALSSIGGSGAAIGSRVYQSAYHAADIRIPAKYGIQQIVGDTCGPAGMMMALRAVPAYMEICREMERRCPDAILLNHSNPMAVLCRAMVKHTRINSIGICHGVQAGIRYAAELLHVDPRELSATWVGTNHYYWFTRLLHRGHDVYPELMRRLRAVEAPVGRGMSRDLSLAYGYQIVYPEDDHVIEFYPWLTQTDAPAELPYDMAADAQKLWDDLPTAMPSAEEPAPEVRRAFMAEYRELVGDVSLPDGPSDTLMGEGVGEIVASIATGRRTTCVVNIPNGGCVPNLPAHALLEVEGVTDCGGVRGLQMGEAPPVLKGMLEKRIVWQELVADAAVTGDRDLVVQACLVDEMSIPPDRTEAMVDELLAASKDLLPQFAGE